MTSISAKDRPRLGISRCLLGDRVRYDGGHKLDEFLRDTLGRFVDFVPVCPEVECGLPVPREAMRLTGDAAAPRLVTVHTGVDHTSRMLEWSQRRIVELEGENLCGFVFKSRSPSSGMERVKVYGGKGAPGKNGVGLFAREFMGHFSRLPVEEEGRLHDPELSEHFIERFFTLYRFRQAAGDRTLQSLMTFHARNKLLLMAHSPSRTTSMGRLLAEGRHRKPPALADAYEKSLMEAMVERATIRRHVNVLQHMLGYFRDAMPADEKQEVLEVVGEYRAGLVPLIVPVTLLRHHVRKYGVAYLADQYYLNPHPAELKLRNHA